MDASYVFRFAMQYAYFWRYWGKQFASYSRENLEGGPLKQLIVIKSLAIQFAGAAGVVSIVFSSRVLQDVVREIYAQQCYRNQISNGLGKVTIDLLQDLVKLRFSRVKICRKALRWIFFISKSKLYTLCKQNDRSGANYVDVTRSSRLSYQHLIGCR